MEYGSVTYQDKELTLQQQAYIALGDIYVAHAVDEDGNDYMITWDIIDEDCEDESDSCDWNDFRVRKL